MATEKKPITRKLSRQMLVNRQRLGSIHPAFHPQMGVPILPIALTAARFLIPVAAGAGAYFALRSEDKDGVTFGIENWKIAYASLAGGIGIAAFLGSGVLPENIQPYATIAGVLGSAAATAILFWPTKPRVRDGDRPTARAPSEAYTKVWARFEKPRLNSEVSKGLFSGDYDAELIWGNDSGYDIEFDHRFWIKETLFGILRDPMIIEKPIIPEPSRVTLNKEGDTLRRQYEIDLESFRGWTSSLIEITVQIFNPNTRVWQSVGSSFFRVT